MVYAELGCHARRRRECRGCGGWYIHVDEEDVIGMAETYEVDKKGRLVKKGNGAEFPLCGPIGEQVKEVIKGNENQASEVEE